jgi:hypothetical protein
MKKYGLIVRLLYTKIGEFSKIFLGCRTLQIAWHTTIGLCDVGGFEILLPGTAAQLKY